MKLPEMPKMPKIKIPKNIGDLKIPPNINTKAILDYLLKTVNDLKDEFSSSSPERRMKYPYTFTAKVAQFPFKFYYKHNILFKAYPWGVAAVLPLFWYISRMSNSKSNKKTWKAIRRHHKEEARHKFDYD
ncbi:unnamed protein product [Ceutorhynchus assimilis]|uniref:Uncharacterized protein n=1 Tax=Ceutorhynchus assimilis TaxID=467358 RepID=A0A9N9MS11_9CUCU|nr:unnamed protein product [Ceutorhynchus assimilis]